MRNSVNRSCAKDSINSKDSNWIFHVLMGCLFLLILLMSLSLGSAVECNADLSQGGTQCTVSTNLVLNGTYVLQRNSSGAFNHYINFGADNVTLDCNGSKIIGNLTSNGYFVNLNKNYSTVKNCITENWAIGYNVGNNNTRLINVSNTNSSTAFVYGTGIRYNFSIYNSSSYRNISGGRVVYFETGQQYNLLIDGLDIIHGGAGGITSNGCFNCILNRVNSTGILGSGASFSAGTTFINGTTNLTISNSQYKGYYYGINVNDISGLNIINSTFRENDIGTRLLRINNTIMQSNTFINNTADYDGYDLNVWMSSVDNITIANSNLSQIASCGAFAEKSSNINITNFSCSFIPMSQRNQYSAKDWFEPPSCLEFAPLYKSYTSFASLENTSWTYNEISQWFNQNVTLSNINTDSNTQVYLIDEGTINLQHDLSNYGLVSHKTPNYLKGRESIYYNPSFNNISLYNQSRIVSNLLSSALFNVRKTQYQIYSDHLYYKNLMVNKNITELYNLSSSTLAHNGTALCNGTTGLVSGDVNITLQPNEPCWILPNYNLTEGITRLYSPIWFAQSTLTERHIASNLSESVNVLVKVDGTNINCNQLNYLSYTPKDEAKQEYTESQAKSICTQLTTTGYTLKINPSAESNVLVFQQGTIDQGICTSLLNLHTLTAGQLTLIVLLIVFGIVLSIVLISMKLTTGEVSPMAVGSVFIIILIGAIMLAVSALITTSLCAL